ncbi:MAG: AsmA family protein [Tepidisphaeraceae bacterium]|jgi:hypothetical protein
MTQGSSNDSANHNSSSDQPDSVGPPKPAKRRRRRWWIIPAAVLVLLIVLVLLAPTIASTGLVRQMVVDHVNQTLLNGKLEIADWSFAWSGGVWIKGIELKDASDAHVLDIGQITTGLSLLKAITGNINLGDVQINSLDFNLRRGKDGQLNLAKLFKAAASSTTTATPTPNPGAKPSKLPNLSGTIHINRGAGTYEDDLPEKRVMVTMDVIDVGLNIKDINQPIQDTVAITARVNNQTAASLKLDGTLAAIQNNAVDAQHASGQQTIALTTSDSPGQPPSADLQAEAQFRLGGPLGILVPQFDVQHGQFDVHRLQDQGVLGLLGIKALADQSLRLNSGRVTIAGKGRLDESGCHFDTPLAVHVDPIDATVKDALGSVQTAQLPPLDLTVSNAASPGSVAAHLTVGAASDPLLAADASADVSVLSKPDTPLSVTLPRLELSKCQGDLARLQAAVGPVLPVFVSNPPATQPGQSSAIQLIANKILVVNSGTFSATMSGSYDGSTVTITKPLALSVENLTVQQNGAATPITAMNLQAALAGSITQRSDGGREINLPTLSLSEGNDLQLAADPAMPIHLVISSGGTSGSGQLKLVRADLPALSAKTAVLLSPQQKASLQQLTSGLASGSIQLKQDAGGNSTAAIDLSVDQLTYGTTVSGQKVSLTAGATLPPGCNDVRNLALSLVVPGATVSVSGAVSDLAGQRKLDGAAVNLDYDLAKLWPLIKPMLPPAQQQKLADLTITAKQKRSFNIVGSFPAGKPFGDAIASLELYGSLTVDRVSTQGVTVQNFELPLWLKNGVVRTVYHDQPEGKNAPKPAICNGGTLDLGTVAVDLRSDPMLLSMPGVDPQHPHVLLKNVALNDTMSKQLLGGALANPIFSGTTTITSQGYLDLSVLQCNAVPLSALLTQQTSQNKGALHVQCATRNMQVGGGVPELLSGKPSISADVKSADVTVQNGGVTQNTTVVLDGDKPVHLAGGVDLAAMQFVGMNIGIPPSLIPRQWVADRTVLSYMPDEIQVPVEGGVSDPQLKFDKVLPGLIRDATQKALLGNLTGQNKKPGTPAASQPSEQNPLGDLLQGLTKPKKKK